MVMALKLDSTKGRAEEFSLTNSVAFMQKKADDIILKVQLSLGRTHSKKGQYVTIHHGETFNKKHMRLLSVFLFLLCVSSGAIYGGIYYTYFWKPCTKKFLYRETHDTCTCATEVHLMWADDKYKWGQNESCAEQTAEPVCKHMH